jgi:integrase/recombinase XerD
MEGDRRVTPRPHVETTQTYIHADMRLKEKALARVIAPDAKLGRNRPDDRLLVFLEML